jgi:hypothetical protein
VGEIVKHLWNGKFEYTAFKIAISGSELWEIKNNCEIVVTSLCKEFSDFSAQEAHEYANSNQITRDDTLVTDFLRYDQSDICDYVTTDFIKRLKAFDMAVVSECTMREFIGPILVSAVVKMDDIAMKICPERTIEGKKGKGPVDYVIVFSSFYICVVEAKRDDLDSGVVQNIAQMKASREMFVRDTRKRGRIDISHIPSWGIVTSGKLWKFVKYYLDEEGNWVLKMSPEYAIELRLDNHDIRNQIHNILGIVGGILQSQKEIILSIHTAKKTRSCGGKED